MHESVTQGPVSFFAVTADHGEVIGFVWADEAAGTVGWISRRASSRGVYEASLEWSRKVSEAEKLGHAPSATLAELNREPGAGPVASVPAVASVEELASVVTEADDRRLLDQLHHADTAVWHELADAFSSLTDEDRRVGRGGGEKLAEGVYRVSYPIYSKALRRAVAALYGVGAVTPEHRWMDHPMPELPSSGRMRPADAVRASTAIVRGERFCEGTIAEAVKTGLFDAVGESLRLWYTELPRS
ncbi:DUF6508 domain-containing protein [Streptomyces sp. NPDC005731]|uniref:DUF6508 domain-containing protein n=1 Tax=Streptomyces sp. NPDC005731 TaxID=3157056 RepID=UPI003401E1BC